MTKLMIAAIRPSPFTSSRQSVRFTRCIYLKVLNRYLHNKWIRPCRSEIEYVQFLAETMLPELLPGDLQLRPLVDLATSVHKAICDRAQTARDAVKELDPNNLQKPLGPNIPERWQWYSYLRVPRIIYCQKYFVLRPLFRAIIISMRIETYNDKDADVSQLPVLLIRTGVEDGLSAPISFEPIAHKVECYIHGSNGETAVQVTLETVVDFFISLENREIAVYGRQPDPVASTRDLEDGGICGLDILYEAQKLGWGDEPLAGPSSQWVMDLETCPKETRWSVDINRRLDYWEKKARETVIWLEESPPSESRDIDEFPIRGRRHY